MVKIKGASWSGDAKGCPGTNVWGDYKLQRELPLKPTSLLPHGSLFKLRRASPINPASGF